MSNGKSQKKISEYRRLIGLREGLSFSDYMDDSVPADVKPSYSLTPMQEGDERIYGQGWLDTNGKYWSVDSHYYWAISYLKSKGIKFKEENTYEEMFRLGFVRITTSRAYKCLNFDHSPNITVNTIQMRIMRNYCIEHQCALEDTTLHKEIDLNEDDFPTQAKDLFKGLWENKETIVKNREDYWLDPNANFIKVPTGHATWAVKFLLSKGISDFGDDPKEKMYELGYVRVKVLNDKIYMSYNQIQEIKPIQYRALKNAAIESNMTLYDTSGKYDKQSDLSESTTNPRLMTDREYWLDVDGIFQYADSGHQDWAETYLRGKSIPFNKRDEYSEEPSNMGCYSILYNMGFCRIYVEDEMVYATCRIPPNNNQLRALKNAAIESHRQLMIGRKSIDLLESKYVNKGNKRLFIESMKPDNLDTFKSHLINLFAYLKSELQLKTIPTLKLISDEKNADKILGKTAYYNPDKKEIVLYTTNRHQKDILRSFAHEIIHHWQHENEKLTEVDNQKTGTKDPQYAQNNPWLRQMEKQAYLLGNMLFRDWEDQKKAQDKKSGMDGKTPKKSPKKEQQGTGKVATDANTKLLKKTYSSEHPYRKFTEGPYPDPSSIKEKTMVIGKDYPSRR